MLGYGQREVILTFYGKKITAREVILPMPPTENNRHQPVYRRGHAVLCNTVVYNKWLAMAKHALMKGKLPRLSGDVAVIFIVVFPDNRRRDAQNREKATFDAFTQCECMYEDDCFIKLHVTRKEVVKGEECIIAYVMPYEELKLDELLLTETQLIAKINQAKEENHAEQVRCAGLNQQTSRADRRSN